MRQIYGIGETVYDIIFKNNQPQTAVPGGSTFNAMISLGRCGLHPVMASEIGDDHVGQIIQDFMRENGVSTDLVTINQGTKTHISLAFLNEQNDAQYQFYKDHASAKFEPKYPEFHENDIVVFGSFFAINPVIRDYTRTFLQRAHDAGSILYYDINFRKNHIADLPVTRDNIIENMKLATVVRGSLEDFGFLYGLDIDDEKNTPLYIYKKYIEEVCPVFICTNGGKAVEVFAPNFHGVYPVKPIETVSTIGAGDNFNAGFAFSLYKKELRLDEIKNIAKPQWDEIVATCQAFSSEVCQSFNNYVSKEFAEVYKGL